MVAAQGRGKLVFQFFGRDRLKTLDFFADFVIADIDASIAEASRHHPHNIFITRFFKVGDYSFLGEGFNFITA